MLLFVFRCLNHVRSFMTNYHMEAGCVFWLTINLVCSVLGLFSGCGSRSTLQSSRVLQTSFNRQKPSGGTFPLQGKPTEILNVLEHECWKHLELSNRAGPVWTLFTPN